MFRSLDNSKATAGPMASTMSSHMLHRCACGKSAPSGGECTECKKKKLDRRASGAGTSPEIAPPIVHDVLNSPGQPLDAASRSYFEPRFGFDFSKVRVHTDGRAGESAQSVQAHAYTVGNNIVFNRGLYRPQAPAGRQLLAHELTHVVQQEGRMDPGQQLRISPADDGYEREAESVSKNVFGGSVSGKNAAIGAPGSGSATLQRACDAAKQISRASASIQHVVIADDDGKNPTSPTSIATAQSIWGKCCIDLKSSSTKTVNKASFKALDESPNDTPTAQETSLFKAAGSGSGIQVFTPQTLKQGGKTGKDISGGGGTYDGGTANPKIVLVEGADGAVLAHEIGHAMGHADHDKATTVMRPTGHYNVANPSQVSADVCTKAKTGAAVTKGNGTKDCCQDLHYDPDQI